MPMRFALLLFSSLIAFTAPPAYAQQIPVIGLAAPLSGEFAILGQQWAEGARVAANANGATELVEADHLCSEDGGLEAAQRLLKANVSIVIGFLCTPAIEAGLPLFKEAGIPVITPIRTNGLTDHKIRTGWPVFRFGPRLDAERAAVAKILTREWRSEFFAIVDDGTIYGRELAESLRAQAELSELSPVFIDTFRPQLDNQIGIVGRLRRAGATHVFVGGDRSDIAIMARDAESLGYDLTLAGGEALMAAEGPVPLSPGVLMVGPPPWSDLATQDALATIAAADVIAEGYVVPGFAAFEVALSAARQTAAEGTSIHDVLSNNTFETAIGTIRFDDKGDLEGEFYRLLRYDGETFVDLD